MVILNFFLRKHYLCTKKLKKRDVVPSLTVKQLMLVEVSIKTWPSDNSVVPSGQAFLNLLSLYRNCPHINW